ncbi:MAG: cyclic nucleotide-binding domain-containing protein [Alphaproteobacteria bacterium]
MSSQKGGLQVLDRKTYEPGTPIFRQGDPGNAAYVVQSGEIEIWVSENGEKRVLGVVAAGGIFGEMALIDNAARMASATAIKPSVCIVIPDRLFQEKMSEADTFIVALLRIFCSNIRSMQVSREKKTPPE